MSAADALASPEMHEAMDLCVSCKGCKRECPTGVDMAKMKIEFLHHWHGRHGWSLKERFIANLPRYAPIARMFAPLVNALQDLGKGRLGFAAQRSLPKWRSDAFNTQIPPNPPLLKGGVSVPEVAVPPFEKGGLGGICVDSTMAGEMEA